MISRSLLHQIVQFGGRKRVILKYSEIYALDGVVRIGVECESLMEGGQVQSPSLSTAPKWKHHLRACQSAESASPPTTLT
jgi:hypothetical protein